MMKVNDTEIEGVKIIEPQVFGDVRGTRPVLKVVADQHGNPTSALAVARELGEILKRPDLCGTFHMTCEGEATWAEFAAEIFRAAGREQRIQPCTTEEFPRPAPRPKNSRLDKRLHREAVAADVDVVKCNHRCYRRFSDGRMTLHYPECPIVDRGRWIADSLYVHYINVGTSTSSGFHPCLQQDYLRVAEFEGRILPDDGPVMRWTRLLCWARTVSEFVYFLPGCDISESDQAAMLDLYRWRIAGDVRCPRLSTVPKNIGGRLLDSGMYRTYLRLLRLRLSIRRLLARTEKP